MDPKIWYASKTIWLNLLSLVAILVQTQTGFVIDAEMEVAILGIINLILRIVTKEEIVWTSK